MNDKTKRIVAGSLAAAIIAGTPISVEAIKKYVDSKDNISYYQQFDKYNQIEQVHKEKLHQLEDPNLYKKIIKHINENGYDLRPILNINDFSLDYASVRNKVINKWGEKLSEEEIIFYMNRIYIVNSKFDMIIIPTGIETEEEKRMYIQSLLYYPEGIFTESQFLENIADIDSPDAKYAIKLYNLHDEINSLKHYIKFFENMLKSSDSEDTMLLNCRNTLRKLSNDYFEMAYSMSSNKKLSLGTKYMLTEMLMSDTPDMFYYGVLTKKQFMLLTKNTEDYNYAGEVANLIMANSVYESGKNK